MDFILFKFRLQIRAKFYWVGHNFRILTKDPTENTSKKRKKKRGPRKQIPKKKNALWVIIFYAL